MRITDLPYKEISLWDYPSWVEFVGNDKLQNIIAKYLARKYNKKLARYNKRVAREEFFSRLT